MSPRNQARRREDPRGFDPVFARCIGSDAYRRFCERVCGRCLDQLNLCDLQQLAALLDAAQLRPGDRVLDVGCGTGGISEHIAEVSGVCVVGIDGAAATIRRARRRAQGRGQGRGNAPRVAFHEADLERLALPESVLPACGFDAALSIDALYFVDDLTATLGTLLAWLKPGGRLVALCSELLDGDDRGLTESPSSRSPAHHSRMARALGAHGLPFMVCELTRSERALWRRRREALAALRDDFLAEGRRDLHDLLHRETEQGLRWVAEGRVRRYLYVARSKG